jgi:hypothetical protein
MHGLTAAVDDAGDTGLLDGAVVVLALEVAGEVGGVDEVNGEDEREVDEPPPGVAELSSPPPVLTTARMVMIASNTAPSAPATASRRRQYTWGGSEPTGCNIEVTVVEYA